MHSLDIDIDDTNLNPRAFRISDTSSYDSNLEVKNGIIEVTVPGSLNPSIFYVNKKFNLVLNAALLHLSNSSELPSLPDGLYKIRFSVSPNATVYAAYYYFRNTKQLNQYMKHVTDLLIKRNKYKRKEYIKLRDELFQIKQFIDGAKYLAEDREKPVEARIVYNEISDLLEKFQC